MKILVIALPVPDSRASVKVASDGCGLEMKGLKYVCNPFDEYAIEQAVQLKERRGDIEEIVAIAIGDERALISLRAALAMGADRGIHVEVDHFPIHDEIAVARVLAEAVRVEGGDYDLILCGKQTIDNDAGELGPALGEYLGICHVGAVVELEVADGGGAFHARRRIEGAEEIVEGLLPVLLSCEKGLVEPRFPSLPNLMKAKKKPMVVLTSQELSLLGDVSAGLRLVSLGPPAARADCRMVEGEASEMALELVNLLRTEAKVI